MTRKTAKISVTVFAIVCAAMLAALNLIPRGNFITGPVITLYIYTPLIIVQLYLLVQVWIIEKSATRALNWNFYSSLLITLIFVYMFYHYLKVTS